MLSIDRLSAGELAALVCSRLARRGVDAVLSGGSCVTVYSRGKYVSKDIDLVLTASPKHGVIAEELGALGFRASGRHYVHPQTTLYLDFLPPPLAVGSEPPREIRSLRLRGRLLRLLSPTDCVKDRLTAWFYWNDRQALAQAVLVAEGHAVDMREVGRWARVEGETARYRAFLKELRRQKPRAKAQFRVSS
jgi:hypothetical protein